MKGIDVSGLAYAESEFIALENKISKGICCDVTKPESLEGVCAGMDIVISVIGITRIKGALTHMTVDYQGNSNLLKEAVHSGVKKFVTISPAKAEQGVPYVPLFQAKFLFEEELKKSGLEWLIFRAGGFFRDLAEMAKMADKGSMFIIGKGKYKSNPMDEQELAEIMVEDSLSKSCQTIEVGGPEDLEWKEVCEACFECFNKKPKLIYVPVWLCKFVANMLKPFSFKYFAMARLLIFTSIVDLTIQKRTKVKFSDYLAVYYGKPRAD